MDEESDQQLLREVVIENSSRVPGSLALRPWDEAKKEWSLLTIYDEPSHCVCKHRIVENCVIRNRLTGNTLVVGNVCINHFREEELAVSSLCRQSLKRLMQPRGTETHSANESLVNLARRLEILSPGEAGWYLAKTTGRGKRTRFDADHANYEPESVRERERLNKLILHGFSSNRPRCACPENPYAKPRQNRREGTYFYSCSSWPHGCEFRVSVARTGRS